MIEEGLTIKLRPDVVVSGDGSTRYVTDVTSGSVFEVNETAFVIMDAARDGKPVAGIVDVMTTHYPDVPRDEVARDVREVVADMVRARLLEVT